MIKKLSCLLLMLAGLSAFAQQTAIIVGKVVDGQKDPLPGVVVTLESPSLQGSRTAVSRANGEFLFRLIPPGRYTLTAVMAGMQTAKTELSLGLDQTARPVMTMQPEATEESLVVTADIDPVLSTTAVVTHFDDEFIEKLASSRDQRSVAALSPGVTNNAFGQQVSISGAPTHANIYMVNGVDSRFDNLRGGPANLVIEDAIQETSILTSSISAEYGNFGGGVINSITKSGGNTFSGTFRTAFTNSDWASRTPIEKADDTPKVDKVNKAYTATIGGPILKDRLWFFGAFYNNEREFDAFFTTPRQLPDSAAIAYGLEPNQPTPGLRSLSGRGTEDERFEIKLTGRITENHEIVASYQDKSFADYNNGSSPLDETGLWPVRNIPVNGYSINYRGHFSDSLSVDLLYSDRESTFEARPTDHIEGDQRITGTLLRDRRTFGRYNSGLFLGKPDEPRGNETLRGKLHYFAVTDNLGSHDMVFGIEDFTDSRLADNRQSLNDWQFWSDTRYEGNTPVPIYSPTSANGRYQSRLVYYPIENPSIGSDLNAKAAYINDSWHLNQNWSFNVGVRFEDRQAKGEDGSLLVDDSAITPRLSASFDPKGDGRHGFTVSYSEYAQRVGDGADNVSTAGSPGFARLDYTGPQTENYLDVISWLDATYGEGFFLDPLNHPGTAQFLADLTTNDLYDPAGQNTVIGRVTPNGIVPDTLQSPTVSEYRLGYQWSLGRKGYFKADFVGREFDNFYIDYRNLQTGGTANGAANLEVITNDDDDYERHYYAVQLQGRFVVSNNFVLSGNYTWSQLYGNIDGEDSSGVSTTAGTTTEYPEWNTFAQRNPVGYLAGDQRHVARLFMTYDWETRAGLFSFGVTQRFESGSPYSKAVGLALTGGRDVEYGFPARNSVGYTATPSTTPTYYIDGRNTHRADSMTQTNLGVNWELPLAKTTISAKVDIFNIFDEDAAPNGWFYNTTVNQGDPFNVFTETPQEGTNYTLDPEWGTPSSVSAYQTPLTFRFDLGIRF
jgi:hypothetical protein